MFQHSGPSRHPWNCCSIHFHWVGTAAARIVSEADLRVRYTVERMAASSTQGLRRLLGMLVVAV
jgi:hypothetical protein